MNPAFALSIIVPSLNAAATIGAALDSLVVASKALQGQTPEIILVDGGSVDDTVKQALARRKNLPGLKIIQQASRGLAAARNEGIAAATSALIGFCDADDAWTPEAMTLRLVALQGQPSSWAVTGQVRFVSVDGDYSAAPARRVAGSEHPGYTPGAMLIHRDIFQMVGPFDETLRIGADGDWILRAVQSLGPPLAIAQLVLEKGLRPGSLSTDVATYRAEMMLIARRFFARERRNDSP
ncbi:glycosyltransferase family 2 protein [Hydrogenophaga taeniospiralis]|uniref:glycosyltransferase family 2 protein n=1 Tax=Hydrogenophaga taeniospiralis TaxID=65656 RepID=UPI001CF999B9|nr:glycosyltransferase [Hydrogenophaga taeniospiralis]UCU92221.1 glycosyltransferase [Hydrogenophaga taeniospiralis]